MAGKLIKGILAWITSILWCLLLSVTEGTFSTILSLAFLAFSLTYVCAKCISYEEFKKVSGYSWLCHKLNIPEEGE